MRKPCIRAAATGKRAIISERDRPRQRPIRSDFLVFPEIHPAFLFPKGFYKGPFLWFKYNFDIIHIEGWEKSISGIKSKDRRIENIQKDILFDHFIKGMEKETQATLRRMYLNSCQKRTKHTRKTRRTAAAMPDVVEQYLWCAAAHESFYTIWEDLRWNKSQPRVRMVPKKGYKQAN